MEGVVQLFAVYFLTYWLYLFFGNDTERKRQNYEGQTLVY